MMTPKPSNITSEHRGNGWNLVHWDKVRGADYYESWHEGEANPVQLASSTSALFAVQPGNRRYTRIRNVVGNLASGWVTVTLNEWGEIVDIDGGDEHPKPSTPTGLRVDSMNVDRRTASVSWAAAADADHWMVRITALGGKWRRADAPNSTLSQLVGGVEYTWQVKAVADYGGTLVESDVAEDTFLFQNEQPPPEQPPKVPSGLQLVSTDPEYASANVAWNAASDAEFWEVLLEDVFPRPRKANSAEYTFSDLVDGSVYGYRVRAVRTGTGGKLLRSGWARDEFTYQGSKPPPPPPPPQPVPKPEGLRTHCITTKTAIVEWEPAAVDGWEVWIGSDRTNAQFTTSTRHNLRGLKPNTRYTVNVVAIKGDDESEVATDAFVTLADEEIEGDLPTPTGLRLETPRPGVLQAQWDGQVPAFQNGTRTSDAFYISCDGLATTTQTDRAAHEWTGLTSGEYVVEVYRATGGGVSGIARSAASVKGARWA